MKSKQVLIFLLVLTMAVFAGCGSKEEVEPAPMEESQEATAEEVETEPMDEGDATTLKDLLAKEQALDSYTYSAEVSMMDGMKSVVTIYKKTPWIRMESKVEDLPAAVTLMNIEEGKLYTIDDMNKQIMVMQDTEMFVEPTDGIDSILEEGTMPEDMDLKEVDYKGKKAFMLDYAFTDPETGEAMGSKIWYDAEYGVPLAYELKMGAEQTMLTEFTYDFGEVSDDLFKLPEDYSIMDLGNMEEMFENMDMEDMDMGENNQ